MLGSAQKEEPLIEILRNDNFAKILKIFPNNAEVKIDKNGYVYGLIKSKLVEDLKCLVEKELNIKLVQVSEIGSHISIFYEDEGKEKFEIGDGDIFSFDVKNVARVKLFSRYFYVVLVESQFIKNARLLNGLSEKPSFKGVAVPLHITIGEEL